VYVVRKRIKLSAEKAIFIFVKNTLPPTGLPYHLGKNKIKPTCPWCPCVQCCYFSGPCSCPDVCHLRGEQGRGRVPLHDLQRREHLWAAMSGAAPHRRGSTSDNAPPPVNTLKKIGVSRIRVHNNLACLASKQLVASTVC
jgi:hypothetical protein